MSPEELLIPRYKLIADYPTNQIPIRTIISLPQNITTESMRLEKEFYEKYPHLFKELHWAEDRKEEDLPKYIKHPISGQIEKVIGYTLWSEGWSVTLPSNTVVCGGSTLRFYLPATEEEYLNYKN